MWTVSDSSTWLPPGYHQASCEFPRGGTPQKFGVCGGGGGVRRASGNPYPFQTKTYDFLYPSPDQSAYTLPYFRPKWSISILHFRPKLLKIHTLYGLSGSTFPGWIETVELKPVAGSKLFQCPARHYHGVLLLLGLNFAKIFLLCLNASIAQNAVVNRTGRIKRILAGRTNDTTFLVIF